MRISNSGFPILVMVLIVLEVNHLVRACRDISSSSAINSFSFILFSPSKSKNWGFWPLWLGLNFSSQLKQRPWVRLHYISSQVRCFMCSTVVVFVWETRSVCSWFTLSDFENFHRHISLSSHICVKLITSFRTWV